MAAAFSADIQTHLYPVRQGRSQHRPVAGVPAALVVGDGLADQGDPDGQAVPVAQVEQVVAAG